MYRCQALVHASDLASAGLREPYHHLAGRRQRVAEAARRAAEATRCGGGGSTSGTGGSVGGVGGVGAHSFAEVLAASGLPPPAASRHSQRAGDGYGWFGHDGSGSEASESSFGGGGGGDDASVRARAKDKGGGFCSPCVAAALLSAVLSSVGHAPQS